jgi:septal ring factor EnvC (AmiA/AmiB activator)
METQMSRYAVTAFLLLPACVGCSNRSESDLAAAKAENDSLKSELTKAEADIKALNSELEKSREDAAATRAELNKARSEAEEQESREVAAFFLTALAESGDQNEARSVCSQEYAKRLYGFNQREIAWKISSQTVSPERDRVTIHGMLGGGQKTFILRLVRHGTIWKVDGFTFS